MSGFKSKSSGPKPTPKPKARPRGRGFASAGSLVQGRINRVSEGRGFSVTRLLTHWSDVVGPEMARLCEPVKVGFAPKGGFGATLTLLVRGPAGPIVQAQSEVIRSRVNACYGYNAISRIRMTQSAAAPGFAEPAGAFAAQPPSPPRPTPEVEETTRDVSDPQLRAALAGLGARIQSRQRKG